jgi:hypothetical protein
MSGTLVQARWAALQSWAQRFHSIHHLASPPQDPDTLRLRTQVPRVPLIVIFCDQRTTCIQCMTAIELPGHAIWIRRAFAHEGLQSGRGPDTHQLAHVSAATHTGKKFAATRLRSRADPQPFQLRIGMSDGSAHAVIRRRFCIGLLIQDGGEFVDGGTRTNGVDVGSFRSDPIGELERV